MKGSVFISLLSRTHMAVNEAIVSSCLARTRHTLKDAAIILRTKIIKKVIKKVFDESSSLKWLPTADDLGALSQD